MFHHLQRAWGLWGSGRRSTPKLTHLYHKRQINKRKSNTNTNKPLSDTKDFKKWSPKPQGMPCLLMTPGGDMDSWAEVGLDGSTRHKWGMEAFLSRTPIHRQALNSWTPPSISRVWGLQACATISGFNFLLYLIKGFILSPRLAWNSLCCLPRLASNSRQFFCLGLQSADVIEAKPRHLAFIFLTPV